MDSKVLVMYLKTCVQGWFGIYLGLCLISSLTIFMIHVAVIGGLLCILSYLRLEPPDPSDIHKLYGYESQNQNGFTSQRCRGSMGLIARRCGGLDAPENSISAARLAEKNGARFVHFDVTFSIDGIPVVSARKDVSSLTSDLIKKLDASDGHVLEHKYKGEKIPTVDNMIDECMALHLKMVVQVGDACSIDSIDKVVQFVQKIFKDQPLLYQSVIILSSWPHLLYLIRKSDPRIVCALSYHPGLFSTNLSASPTLQNSYARGDFSKMVKSLGDSLLSWAIHDFLWYLVGISAIFVHKESVSPSYVQIWSRRGVRPIAYTVNSSIERAYLEYCIGVSCMSDTLDELPLEHAIKLPEGDVEDKQSPIAT